MSSKVSFISFTPLFFLLLLSPVFSSSLPNPDPSSIQPLHVASSPPATIPAFPEQSNLAGCPLNLSEELFRNVKTACGVAKPGDATGQLHRSRCCPVLASWLYAAYSATALGGASSVSPAIVGGHSPASVDLPLLPDDSETCVDDLGKALKQRGIELVKPNETCDVVYCYCGIRLHPLNCPEAFFLNQKGKLSGNEHVKRLERDCLSSSSNVNGFPGLGGCNKCLHSLHQLNSQASNASKSDERTAKIRNKDCQLMGLTWLLSKNRKAYIHTVSAVIRAMMMNTDGSDPQSCTLTSDGMPLAVDSSDISNQSSSITRPVPLYLWLLSLYLLCRFLTVPSGLF
ncbi:uncharacterized GPI-anchored protein At4g28100-like [Mangifera indica]|uniref:uncharacterized GPI-anchored protein At4g28100-like n=1 Tax=Mangifera indica TaxID=29780 RepID=UPI001CF99B17|nr:uncharacterized GPI-anchored protein At4g28100-like [Mangifera indica]